MKIRVTYKIIRLNYFVYKKNIFFLSGFFSHNYSKTRDLNPYLNFDNLISYGTFTGTLKDQEGKNLLTSLLKKKSKNDLGSPSKDILSASLYTI